MFSLSQKSKTNFDAQKWKLNNQNDTKVYLGSKIEKLDKIEAKNDH